MTTVDANQHIIRLEECIRDSGGGTDVVGGKATGLGALLRHDCPVPPGFAITTRAYRDFIDENHLAEPLDRLLSAGASDQIRALFEATCLNQQLEYRIGRAYASLSEGDETPVAVRSSATAEDTAFASFAGQQQTYLGIKGAREVVRHVVRCWASLYSPQAIAYRARMSTTQAADLAMGVVVQKMIAAAAAGVMMTLDPVTGDPSTVMIEGAYGLGVAVVNGEVTPDLFCIDKTSLAIRSRTIGDKAIAYRFDPAARGSRVEDVPRALQARPCLTDDEVVGLARLGKRMEQAMARPLDLEWAIGPGPNGQREIFLLQARPETVWSQKLG